jgi:hypothetical protein
MPQGIDIFVLNRANIRITGLISGLRAGQSTELGQAGRIWPHMRAAGGSRSAPKIGRHPGCRAIAGIAASQALIRADLGWPTVLQTLPRSAVASANAAGAPGLRTYLARDESRRPACADGSARFPPPSSSIAAIPLGLRPEARMPDVALPEKRKVDSSILSLTTSRVASCKSVTSYDGCRC